MSKAKNTSGKWDISVLFQGPSDPNLEKILLETLESAKILEKKFKGKIKGSSFSLKKFVELMSKYECILQTLDDVNLYSTLSVYVDQSNKKAKELMSKYSRTDSSVKKILSFIDLEVGEYVHKKPDIINKEDLKPFKHYLNKLIKA